MPLLITLNVSVSLFRMVLLGLFVADSLIGLMVQRGRVGSVSFFSVMTISLISFNCHPISFFSSLSSSVSIKQLR